MCETMTRETRETIGLAPTPSSTETCASLALALPCPAPFGTCLSIYSCLCLSSFTPPFPSDARLGLFDFPFFRRLAWLGLVLLCLVSVSRIDSFEKGVRIPDTESLQQCATRILPLWRSIVPRLHDGETVLIVGHANSIRALVMLIDGGVITDAQLREISIPSAVPLIYDFESISSADLASRARDRGRARASASTSIVDDGCGGGPVGAGEPAGVGSAALKLKHLCVKGTPSPLGMRGRYLVSKDLLSLLDHKEPTSGLPTVQRRYNHSCHKHLVLHIKTPQTSDRFHHHT